MGSAWGFFWWRIFRFNWFGHQLWFDPAPIDIFVPDMGHLLALFSDMVFLLSFDFGAWSRWPVLSRTATAGLLHWLDGVLPLR
jgi:hypothetical protein